MAVRQYIGARYVIKIHENSTDPSSAEWEQGNYEPLVMVTWQNGSYLSKKEVPGTVGNPANNPSYWVQTGFYNGQIASLQQQIDTINNTKIPSIEAAIQSLADESYEKDFFNGKNILIIGDSLCDPDTMAPNWVTLFKNYVENLGATVDTTFCNDGDSFAGFVNVGRINDLDNYSDDFDIVIVALGVNDYQGQYGIGYYSDTAYTNFSYGGVSYVFNSIACENLLLTKIRERMPHAIQYYCPPHRTARVISDDKKIPLTAYRYAFSTVAMLYGARIIDWSSMPMFAPQRLGADFAGYTATADVLHPQPTYAPIMMEYIKQQLLCGGTNDWKESADGFSFPINATELGTSTENANIIITSHGKVRVYLYAQCNFTSNYVTLFDSFPMWFDSAPKEVLINKKPTTIEFFQNKVIVYKPSDVETATTILVNIEFEMTHPMNRWINVTD